jgi:SprT protein
MSATQIKIVLGRYLPSNTLDYCVQLWVQHPFHFTVTKKRSSRYGDYTFNSLKKEHTITVNGDLNPYAFLITYLHEYAHLLTSIEYGPHVSSHGQEWKTTFRNVMQAMLQQGLLPDELRTVLLKHMKNPKASSSGDTHLVLALRKYDKNNFAIPLMMVNKGSSFSFNERIYQFMEKRRTRVLCKEQSEGKLYLIHKAALVEIISTEG